MILTLSAVVVGLLLRRAEAETATEREARKQYTATVKEQTNSSSQLRAELKEHRRHETLRCQHKQQDLQILANQRLTEVHGRLAHERGRSMHLLNQGRSVVKEARLADQAIWSKLTSLSLFGQFCWFSYPSVGLALQC